MLIIVVRNAARSWPRGIGMIEGLMYMLGLRNDEWLEIGRGFLFLKAWTVVFSCFDFLTENQCSEGCYFEVRLVSIS